MHFLYDILYLSHSRSTTYLQHDFWPQEWWLNASIQQAANNFLKDSHVFQITQMFSPVVICNCPVPDTAKAESDHIK